MNRDTAVAILGLVGAVALLPMNLVVTHIYAHAIPLALGAGCGVYLIARVWPAPTARSSRGGVEPPSLSSVAARGAPSLVFLGASALVVLAVRAGGRTLPFYVLAVALMSLVFVQIVFADEEDLHVGLLLTQILVVASIVRFAALATTPGFIGVDIWIHIPSYAADIYEANGLSGIGGSKYFGSPLYHLLVVVTALVADVSLRSALYLSLGTAMALSALLIYATARPFVSPRWALFATAAFGVSDHVIRWSIHLIPTSMGVLFFLAILLVLVRLLTGRTDGRHVLLMVFLLVAVVLTHQVSAFIVLIALFGGAIIGVLFETGLVYVGIARIRQFGASQSTVPLSSYFAFHLGLLIFVWSVTPYHGRPFLLTTTIFLRDAVESSFGLFALGGPGGGGAAASASGTGLLSTIATYSDHFGLILLLFGTVVGGLYVLRSERVNQAEFTLVAIAGLFLCFAMVPPLFGIGTFVPGRWFAFLYAPMVIVTAIGFERFRFELVVPLFVACVLVFALVFPGAMILSTQATLDDPAFEEQSPRQGFTESELTAAATIGEITTEENGLIYTDTNYAMGLNRIAESRFARAMMPQNDTPTHDSTIYRTYQSDGAPQFLDENGELHVHQTTEGAMCGSLRNQVYTNGDVALCHDA